MRRGISAVLGTQVHCDNSAQRAQRSILYAFYYIPLHFFTALQRARPGSLNLENLLDAEVGFIFISSWTTGPPAKLSSSRGGMPRSQQARFEEAGGQRLPLGGINGYIGVRGKQGRRKDKYPGRGPEEGEPHAGQLFDTAREAAIAFAQLREDLELRMLEPPPNKKPATPATCAAPKRFEVGVYIGNIFNPLPPGVPTVWACAHLSPQQANLAAARGVAVPVAYADDAQ